VDDSADSLLEAAAQVWLERAANATSAIESKRDPSWFRHDVAMATMTVMEAAGGNPEHLSSKQRANIRIIQAAALAKLMGMDLRKVIRGAQILNEISG